MGIGILYISAVVVYFLAARRIGKIRQHQILSRHCQPPAIHPTDIVVYGRNLFIPKKELHAILDKRCSYYRQLNSKSKAVFLSRLRHFLHCKTFIIKSGKGFREMPVLVSASAVHLTFGLPDYQLPFYRYIRIYPTEFVSDDFTRILAGNVSSNVITVSWNHFLAGNHHENDGANLGLHEMSHALFFQKMEVEKGYAKKFAKQFEELCTSCREAFNHERAGIKNLYSVYAEKNLQEFWAESVELFFEKPVELIAQYPVVYSRMVSLLNQDPLRKDEPVVNGRKALSLKFFPSHPVTQLKQSFSNWR